MAGQVVEQYPDPQLWITNDPDRYSNTYRNRAGPNTAGKGNVGGQTHDFRDSQDIQIGTIDDRGFLSSRAVVGLTGELKSFPKSVTNANLLLCDGQAVSRTTYANLFTYLGTTFGVGDGSTTFNLPNYRDVVFGGIGPSLFLVPQTVYGSNSVVDISHLHTGAVHTHPSSAHTHTHSATHTHTATTSSDGTGSTSSDGTGATSSDGTGSTSADGTGNTGTPSTTTTFDEGGGASFTVASNTHRHSGPSHSHSGPAHTHSGPAHTHSGPAHTHTLTTTAVAPGTSDSTTPPDTGAASAANTGTAGTTTLSVIQATMGWFVYIVI